MIAFELIVSDPISSQALLLIDHIASLAKRLIGQAAHAKQLQLQLISRKDRAGQPYAQLSVMTLATRVIDHARLMRSLGDPLAYLHRLRDQAFAAIQTPAGF